MLEPPFLVPLPPAGAAIVVAFGVRPSGRELSTLKASTGNIFGDGISKLIINNVCMVYVLYSDLI